MPNSAVAISDSMSDRIKHYVTWRVVAELMRRHKQREDLYVMELHPAGGQGDTLALFRGVPGTAGATSLTDLRGWRRLGDLVSRVRLLEESGGYVGPWLRAEDPKEVVDAVGEAIGLRQPTGQLPPTSPTVRTFRLMADVLGHALNSRRSLQWRSAWFDSSGLGGSFVREEFLAVRNQIGTGPTADSRWPGDVAHLLRFWILVDWRGHPGTPAAHAVVDLRGRVWSAPRFEQTNVTELVGSTGSQQAAALQVWLATGLR